MYPMMLPKEKFTTSMTYIARQRDENEHVHCRQILWQGAHAHSNNHIGETRAQ